MKYLKKYILLLFALAFIALGAVLPYFTSQIQDAQINELQKKTELSTVSLMLRQEDDVWPALQLISEEHMESVWTGKTALTKADASKAALTTMETMDQYNLLPEDHLGPFLKSECHAESHLLVAEDGNSVLVWVCTWDDSPGTSIMIDDTTGKAVQILTENAHKETDSLEGVYIHLERWYLFLQDYYDIELTEVKENHYSVKNGVSALFSMWFSSRGGTMLNNLSLEITNTSVFFNY